MYYKLTMDTQFDGEDILALPDPNKEYWCTEYTKSTGFTLLMKWVLLTKKHNFLIDNIKELLD